MKKYIIIAGVNGSGKSTLYQMYENLKTMPRVNTDEILRSFGDWRNNCDLMKAGKIAVRKLHEYLDTGITFNQETTLCGKSIIHMIKSAKEKGYYIELHYIGLDSAEIAKKRVQYRVRNGGHGIPDKDIEKRYKETFENLVKVQSLCDLLVLYDNTEKISRFAIYKNEKLLRLSKKLPKWYNNLNN